MMLVATEHIHAGGAYDRYANAFAICPPGSSLTCHYGRGVYSPAGEVRIDYDSNGEERTLYWGGKAPPEVCFRDFRVTPPPPTGDEPIVGWLAAMQTAAAAGEPLPPIPEPEACAPIPWEAGGDERLRAAVSRLLRGRAPSLHKYISWAAISTHLPGRSGRECRERFLWMQAQSQPA